MSLLTSLQTHIWGVVIITDRGFPHWNTVVWKLKTRMHTLSQSFILNLTPQVNPFSLSPFYCFLFFSNFNICLQMIRHRQRVQDFVSCSSNSSHFCHSLKHRHSAMRIFKRHYFFFLLFFGNFISIACLFEQILCNMTWGLRLNMTFLT